MLAEEMDCSGGERVENYQLENAVYTGVIKNERPCGQGVMLFTSNDLKGLKLEGAWSPTTRTVIGELKRTFSDGKVEYWQMNADQTRYQIVK